MEESIEALDAQQRLIQLILDVFLESERWPNYDYVASTLDELYGIDADTVVRELPVGRLWPGPAGGAQLQPSQEIGLTLLGVYEFRGNQVILDTFLRSLRWAVAQRSSFRPAPHEYVEPTWRFADFVGGIQRSASGISRNLAVLCLKLMEHEPDLIRWGGPPDNPLEWTLTIPTTIRRYRDCSTIEDYLSRRFPAAEHQTQPENMAIQPVNDPDSALHPLPAHLHPEVLAVASRLFRDGHYASAILEAFKAIMIRVKKLSGLDSDGKPLMSQAFSANYPLILVNQRRDQVDRDEQEGFMYLFMGAAQGIRNPKAHALNDEMDPSRAIDYLSFASLLMRRLDDAEQLLVPPDTGPES